MSLAGRAAIKGSTVSWYRPSGYTQTADGGQRVTSWTTMGTAIAAEIQPISDEWVQKIFGAPETVKDRALIPGTQVFLPKDAIKVTAGFRAGKTYRVFAVGGQARTLRGHADLALESTTESIP